MAEENYAGTVHPFDGAVTPEVRLSGICADGLWEPSFKFRAQPGTIDLGEPGNEQTMFIAEDASHTKLPWETLEALIKGISSIDLTGMPTTDRMEAYNFILHYGYDLRIEEDAAEVRGIMEEAVRVIESLFLTHPGLDWEQENEPPSPCREIPAHVIESGDPLDLILTAAQSDHLDRPWACAILKVMHTIAHIQNGPLYRYFEEARKQILSEFQDILTPYGEDGSVLLGKTGAQTLKLYGFETKDQKTRESILVKLLCKKEHVAEAIWDLIGVRLITDTPAEAVQAINILREQKVIVFPNIIPSRSRNSLIDFARYREAYERAQADLTAGRTDMDAFQEVISHIEAAPAVNQDFNLHNPMSSGDYRSIHITCRKLVRLKEPGLVGENRFFFPYEIQILDKDSYLQSKEGSSSHSAYKKKQLATARRRVLGLLLKPGGQPSD